VVFPAFAALLLPLGALAAPYADFVIDARTGQVLHETNADARLHPASLTKMMTLYIAFEAIEHGEISLDTMVTVSKYAASQPPSRLGLRAGQKIALRYLIRAAAIKSANDAASAIGDAIEGDKERFARRMNRTAKALGMTRTTFRNANGLTEEGHLSTARDMTTLGRRLFFDFPQYYSLFSRRTADAGIAQVASTNRRFLDSYEGADGIKTGYTGPAGFNLTASAQRGKKRIIATVFGGKSTTSRNARVAELLDLGFGKAPNRAKVQAPPPVDYMAHVDEPAAEEDLIAEAIAENVDPNLPAAGKTLRVAGAISESPRPRAKGSAAPVAVAAVPSEEADAAIAEEAAELAAATDVLMAEMEDTIAAALEEAVVPAFEQTTAPQPETLALAASAAPADASATAEAPQAIATASAIAPESTPRPPARPATAVAAAAPAAAAVVAAAEAAPAPQPLIDPPKAEAEPSLVAALPEGEPIGQTPVSPADSALAEAIVLTPAPKPEPKPEPQNIVLAAATADPAAAPEELEIVTRVSTSGGREWGINVGSFSSRYNAERELLRTALVEMATLDEALRKVTSRKGAFDANFVGMTEETAQLACRRLIARGAECSVLGPTAN
jgi:D-alanyl-D-alanine carboxypeptidase